MAATPRFRRSDGRAKAPGSPDIARVRPNRRDWERAHVVGIDPAAAASARGVALAGLPAVGHAAMACS